MQKINLSPDQIRLLARGKPVTTLEGCYSSLDARLKARQDPGPDYEPVFGGSWQPGQKYLLVEYEFRSGDYTCRSHCVIQTTKNTKDNNAIHKFFLEFNNDCEVDEKAYSYFYLGCCIGCKIKGSKRITRAEYEILSNLGVA